MLKVFLVEDESVIREGLVNKIPWEEYGYKLVGDAADGEMALPMIRKTKPDVLITDIKMPFMDGLSLSKVVSAEFPQIKTIIISGYDDFEYARQAIEVGVEQYLLKPITRQMLKKTLLELKEKIELDLEQKDYQTQFMNEMQEYEQFSRRHFFERLLGGELSVRDIYEESAKLSLELTATGYNLLFFSLQRKKAGMAEDNGMDSTSVTEEILHYFLRHPQYVPFSWNANCYGVLIKSETIYIEELTQKGIEQIRQTCENADRQLEWYVAVGKPVERLSALKDCYQEVNRYLAYRFILPSLHLLTEETLSDHLSGSADRNIEHVNASKMDQDIIRDFLTDGNISEIESFVGSYLHSVQEALESRMFRDYVVLNIRFTVISYVESLGETAEVHAGHLHKPEWNLQMTADVVAEYFADMLQAALQIRDEKSDSQGRKLLRKALEYIDGNYTREDLSLIGVAEEVGVSSNYLSAVFSQSMQQTFIEYVTAKRMEQARKLLKSTDSSLAEIANAVGYKDAHYFSFVFKKTQGVSPKEYR